MIDDQEDFKAPPAQAAQPVPAGDVGGEAAPSPRKKARRGFAAMSPEKQRGTRSTDGEDRERRGDRARLDVAAHRVDRARGAKVSPELLAAWNEMHPDAEPVTVKPRRRFREKDGGQSQARAIAHVMGYEEPRGYQTIAFPRGPNQGKRR